MALVAGVDSSTQACKVVIRDAASGELVREGRAPHPLATEVDPRVWEHALDVAVKQAGGLDDVSAVAIAAQQHGMVALDEAGDAVRPALLWNDTRSATAADELVRELGGGQAWADAVGVVPIASLTITKLRWLATHEPAHARRVAAVCLPHDWLSWRLGGSRRIEGVFTDRSDASGTAYWSSATGYRYDLVELALGHVPALPRVTPPSEIAGLTRAGAILAPGAGDNAAAVLSLGAEPGDVVVSVGTSGVASAVSNTPVRDPRGAVAGFADATGRFLPLACTLNAAPVLDAVASLLGVDHDRLSDLALSCPAGAGGLVLVPYLNGERTPNRPFATGALHGLTHQTMSPAHLARAAVEGVLCGLADAIDAIAAQGIPVRRVLLIGGGARSAAVTAIAPSVFGCPVVVPTPADYVADGAAKQAAWVLGGGQHPPLWRAASLRTHEANADPSVRLRYADARAHVLERDTGGSPPPVR